MACVRNVRASRIICLLYFRGGSRLSTGWPAPPRVASSASGRASKSVSEGGTYRSSADPPPSPICFSFRVVMEETVGVCTFRGGGIGVGNAGRGGGKGGA